MSKEHLAFIGVEGIVRVLLMVCVCNSRSKENHRGGLVQREVDRREASMSNGKLSMIGPPSFGMRKLRNDQLCGLFDIAIVEAKPSICSRSFRGFDSVPIIWM
jgi:hypothetical protein